MMGVLVVLFITHDAGTTVMFYKWIASGRSCLFNYCKACADAKRGDFYRTACSSMVGSAR